MHAFGAAPRPRIKIDLPLHNQISDLVSILVAPMRKIPNQSFFVRRLRHAVQITTSYGANSGANSSNVKIPTGVNQVRIVQTCADQSVLDVMFVNSRSAI